MIKKYNGFEAKKSSSGFPQLPVGGYVGEIKSAKTEDGQYGTQLIIAYDVTEGEYAGFWNTQYKNDTRDERKWGGIFYVTIPNESDEAWKRRAFENLIWAVEESNNGYSWDWDENSLKGKKCGFLIGEVESLSRDGTQVFVNTRCRDSASIDDIRSGDFKIPKKKEVKNKPKAQDAFTEVSDDDEVPFF